MAKPLNALLGIVLLLCLYTAAAVADVLVMSSDGTISGTATRQGAMFYKNASGLYGIDTSLTTDGRGGISATAFEGDGSRLLNVSYPQNVSITNLSVSVTSLLKAISNTDSLTMGSTSLPTCNATTSVGQFRRSGVKSCYCDGTSWKNTAPAGLLTVLGVNVLVADTCP